MLHEQIKNQLNKEIKWQNWPYKNTTMLLLSFVILILLAKTNVIDSTLMHIGRLGYVGAFIAGIFFVSTFTVVPAALVLFHIADDLNPVIVAITAGLGAMLGDYILYNFIKDKIFDELWPLFNKLGLSKLNILFKSPYFAWMLPVFGAFVIASPFPDEVGVGMMGLSKIKRWQFFLLAFALNAVGIFVVVTAAELQ